MNETIALTKYVWTRYRIFLWILFLIFVVACTLTVVSTLSQAPHWLTQTSMGFIFLSVLVALVCPIGLFGFSRQSNLLDPTSGYDRWLLRLPIANWKLAMIPAGWITVWITVVWGTTVLVCRFFGAPALPIVSQSLGMSACGITACALVWMPFRAAWQRIVLAISAMPLLYFVGLGAVAVSFDHPTQMRWAIAGIGVCYIAAVLFAVYSVKQSRVGRFQQTKRAHHRVARESTEPVARRSFSHWPEALNWYDAKRSRASKLRRLLGMLPVVALLFWVIPVSAGSAIFALVFVAALGGVLTVQVEPAVWGARSSLPSYLIASPIPSRPMAFIRLRKFATEYVLTMLCVTLLWLTCFAWQSNRETAWRWWATVAEASASSTVPLRMVAAIYLAILMVMLGGSLRSVCVLLRGRQTIILWLFAACCTALMSPLIGMLGWFLQQRDWEQVTRVANDWLVWSYRLFYIALVAKIVFDAGVVWLASRHMFSWREIAIAITGWCVVVIAAACSWYALWPYAGVQFVTVLMATSLAIPLSVCFAGPLAVQANRHLRVAR